MCQITCFSSHSMSMSRKGTTLLSQLCSTSPGLSSPAARLTSSLQISSEKRATYNPKKHPNSHIFYLEKKYCFTSVRSLALSFSLTDRSL